ncbi:MAG: ATP-dependent Clp protease ATP-binding subunit [Patescibacteria group bacterium]
METKINPEKLLFSEPRLEFPAFLRYLWRICAFLTYAVLVTGTATFILSDVDWLKWLGILIAIFLADRFYTAKKALHSVTELNNHLIEGINVADYISPKSFRLIEKAFNKTLAVGGSFYLYLLKSLVRGKGIRGALWRLEVTPEEFEKKIDEEIEKLKNQKLYNQKDLIEKVAGFIKSAFFEAYANKDSFIGTNNLFAVLSCANDEAIRKIFYLFGIDGGDLGKALIFSRFRVKQSWAWLLPETLGGFARKHTNKIRHRYMNRAWTAKPTPVLDNFSVDLTDAAREGEIGFLIGHEKDYEQMVNVLSRPTRPNVLLVGEPGSGKETLVNHLAFSIVKDKIFENLFDKRVVSLQISSLVSGADPAEISKRVLKVVEEISGASNVILYISDIHNLVKTSGENYMNAADIILPILTTDVFQVIGATYPREFKQNLESRSDFINAFEIIRVEEISEDDAIRLLTYESVILERQYRIIVSFPAIKQAVILAHKYFHQILLPLSAENLLKEALAFATQRGDKALRADHVISVAERKTNVPIHKATKDEAAKLLNLEDSIHVDLIDQEEAVKNVAGALREYRAGLSRTSGPIAAFLFVGPTGVGKTELAKILAKTQFGSEEAMIRFDMSEYQDKQSFFRFVGSPDGKISGGLTEAVIQKPYSLILLDEFEKANPDVLNLFLQVFDDGRLTDNLGRVVDFKNTIIISTSNANSEYIKEQLESGKSIKDFKDEFKKKLTAYFKPELLNRFSDIMVFKNLSPDDILKIAGLQLKKLGKTLEENQGIILEFSDDVIKFVAKIGYDPVFGARPLRGVISEKIKSVLAEKILKGEIQKGGKISVGLKGEELEFGVK